MAKIYSDDPLVPYKTTTISPERTKAEIDGILAEWQLSDYHWHWKPEQNDVYVQFLLEEKVDEVLIKVTVKVVCPIIWDRENKKGRPPRPEQVNLRISMRCMWWFIKSHLEMAYVTQSSKTAALLPYIASADGHTLKDLIIPRLSEFEALPSPNEERKQLSKIITIPSEEAKDA